MPGHHGDRVDAIGALLAPLVQRAVHRKHSNAEICHDTADDHRVVERLRRRALRENRFDDASDEVIRRRLEVYERDTKPVLGYYPKEKVVRVEATMSQIRVLSSLVKFLVPLKEEHDLEREQGAAAQS